MGSRRARAVNVWKIGGGGWSRKRNWRKLQNSAALREHIGLGPSSATAAMAVLTHPVTEFEKKLHPGKYRNLVKNDKEKQEP